MTSVRPIYMKTCRPPHCCCCYLSITPTSTSMPLPEMRPSASISSCILSMPGWLPAGWSTAVPMQRIATSSNGLPAVMTTTVVRFALSATPSPPSALTASVPARNGPATKPASRLSLLGSPCRRSAILPPNAPGLPPKKWTRQPHPQPIPRPNLSAAPPLRLPPAAVNPAGSPSPLSSCW